MYILRNLIDGNYKRIMSYLKQIEIVKTKIDLKYFAPFIDMIKLLNFKNKSFFILFDQIC